MTEMKRNMAFLFLFFHLTFPLFGQRLNEISDYTTQKNGVLSLYDPEEIIVYPSSDIKALLINEMELELDSILKTSLSKLIPGLTAAVSIKGEIIWSGAAGISSEEEIMKNCHSFGIASISKTFISAMVLKFVEEGVLRLDNKISDFLPSMKNINGSITISQLMNHTSGIFDPVQHPDYMEIVLDPNNLHIWTPEEILSSFILEAYFSPGTSFKYSNANAIILGLITEKIANNPLSHILRSEIFYPYRLNRTWLCPDDGISLSNLADYWYDINADGILENITDSTTTIVLNSTVWSGGNIISNAVDIARWGAIIFESGLVNQNSINLIKSESNSDYSFGFMRKQYGSSIAYGHSGGFIHSGEFAYFPDEKICISVFSNASVIENVDIMVIISNVLSDIKRVIDSTCKNNISK